LVTAPTCALLRSAAGGGNDRDRTRWQVRIEGGVRLSRVLELRVDGRPIGLARILLAFALAVCILESAAVLRGIAGGKLRYPVLPALRGASLAGVQICVSVGVLAAVLLRLGIFASAASATGSALLAGALLWDQQTYSSHHLLVTLLLAYLAFARS